MPKSLIPLLARDYLDDCIADHLDACWFLYYPCHRLRTGGNYAYVELIPGEKEFVRSLLFTEPYRPAVHPRTLPAAVRLRLEYTGDEKLWRPCLKRSPKGEYEPVRLFTGEEVGTPEECIDAVALTGVRPPDRVFKTPLDPVLLGDRVIRTGHLLNRLRLRLSRTVEELPAVMMIGDILMDLGFRSLAVEAFKRALKWNPACVEASLGIAIDLVDRERYAEALEILDAARRLRRKWRFFLPDQLSIQEFLETFAGCYSYAATKLGRPPLLPAELSGWPFKRRGRMRTASRRRHTPTALPPRFTLTADC